MRGARHAKGENLIFLHVDTRLSEEAIKSLLGVTAHFVWGFFHICLDSSNFKYNILSYFINLRSKIFKYATGDQVVIIQKNFLKSLKVMKIFG